MAPSKREEVRQEIAREAVFSLAQQIQEAAEELATKANRLIEEMEKRGEGQRRRESDRETGGRETP